VRGDTILETEDLSKDFAGFVAVRAVNLRVARGSIHAMIGPNGAGKTTCFNLLSKFLNPHAPTENPTLVRAFGINVPRMMTLTYGFGVGLAGLAGVMAAPIYNVSPQMGSDIIIVVFAVVVIGGMGSIMGAILTGFTLGIVEGLTKVFFPEASNTVIFAIMIIVLFIRPAGLFGRLA